ncbi:MAG: sulfurtransferase [Bacteroidota bacterium]
MYNSIISVDELVNLLAQDEVLVLDVRYNLFQPDAGRIAWRNAHIPGAHYLHLDKDLSGEIVPGVTGRHPLPNQDVFRTLMLARGLQTDIQVVVYDDKGGGIAARLWWMLHWIGYEAVAVLDGGWPAWMEGKKRPTESSLDTLVDRPNSPKNDLNVPFRKKIPPFTHNLPHLPTLGRQAVNDLRNDSSYCLVDSRTTARYRGEKEPIDPIAGHIPGAENLPWPENLTPTGCFKTKEELKSHFAHLNSEAARTIFYCGSGVTACHNILAYYYVYGKMPALYPGSWSDWITQPGCEIAT